MSCLVCGSSEFTVNDGVFYCSECDTQIKETCDEQSLDVSFSRKSLLSSPTVEKVLKDKKKTCSSWITVECYNIIIFKQVQALINLGASPKLKQTVLYIWSKYLEKCEIAFRKDYKAQEGIPHLGPVPAKRDIRILYKEKITSPKKSQEKEQANDEEMDDSSISDSSSMDEESESASDTEPIKIKYSSHITKLQRTKGLKKKNRTYIRNQVFTMTMPKTLSFCYLGLLYTDDQLSLCDLIRFVHEDKIPYINIIDKLPREFKLQDRDNKAFLTYAAPDAHTIFKMSHKISQFLNLPQFKEPSVLLAVSLFLKDLNLPDDLKPIVKILFEQFKKELCEMKYNPSHKDIPPDCQALAFIIIALKMLFILDDKFEIEHSKVMTKLNDVKAGHKYFVWTEWKKQACLKEYLFLSEEPGYYTINKFDSLSADQMISKYAFRKLRTPSAEEMLNPRNILVSQNEMLKIIPDLISIPDKTDCEPTSFPLTHKINYFVKEWRTLPMFKETKEIDFTLLKKDFTLDSLAFNPLHYKSQEDVLNYKCMASLYIPGASISESGEHYSTPNQVIRTSSDYWFLNIQGHCRSQIAADWLDKVPLSFKWLINFICKYANYNYTVLYQEILHIEKVLFFQRTKIKESLLNTFHDKLIDF